MKKCKVLLIAALAALAGCNLVNDLVHDDQVVAKACGEKLYLSVLSQYIPDGLTPEDSTRLALQYINSWASDILFKHTAEAQLSKEDKWSKILITVTRMMSCWMFLQRFPFHCLPTVKKASCLL